MARSQVLTRQSRETRPAWRRKEEKGDDHSEGPRRWGMPPGPAVPKQNTPPTWLKRVTEKGTTEVAALSEERNKKSPRPFDITPDWRPNEKKKGQGSDQLDTN